MAQRRRDWRCSSLGIASNIASTCASRELGVAPAAGNCLEQTQLGVCQIPAWRAPAVLCCYWQHRREAAPSTSSPPRHTHPSASFLPFSISTTTTAQWLRSTGRTGRSLTEMPVTESRVSRPDKDGFQL